MPESGMGRRAEDSLGDAKGSEVCVLVKGS
jgi:hypothetical protein